MSRIRRIVFGSTASARGAGAPEMHARTLQQHLAAAGFLAWRDVTGRFDPATREATARFQAWRGLPAHGDPDRATCDGLLEATSARGVAARPRRAVALRGPRVAA